MEILIKDIRENAITEIKSASTVERIEELFLYYLGRKGVLSQFTRKISSFPLNQRSTIGKYANETKNMIVAALHDARISIDVKNKSDNNYIDVSLPGRSQSRGHIHPITLVVEQICDIFSSIGFNIVEGHEIETDYYNFEALNLPKNHPARDMHDTFYVSDDIVLRTHTSSIQPRIMEKYKPPIRIISPGKAYRRDSDVTHTPMFHQIEGLFVDSNVSFSDLKGNILIFIRKMFGDMTKIRFRPSFFPFTEPSAEVDIECVICDGFGCRVCSKTGWIEILGAGMVHPNVFKKVRYDTGKYTGFAFGMGVERIAMVKYRVDDIRRYFDNDIRFLSQF